MSLAELRAFLADERLLELLDAELAKPAMQISTDRREPSLRQAIQRVIEPDGNALAMWRLGTELGPWIEAYNAILTFEGPLGASYMRANINDLTRPEGTAALIALSRSKHVPIRIAALEALSSLPSTPAMVDVFVHAARDSSAKVRAIALGALPKLDAVPKLRVARDAAKGKQRALFDAALEVLAPNATAGDALADQLVAIWRETHQMEVANLVDQLPAEPVSGRSMAERELAWHSSTDRAAQLATPWPKKWDDAWKRVEVMREWNDPRVATAIRKLLEARPYASASSAIFYALALEVLSSIPDQRQRERLNAIRERLFPELSQLVQHRPQLEAVLEGTVFEPACNAAPAIPYTAAQSVVVEAARARLVSTAATVSNETELLAEIYANPEDDAPRLVYADLLNSPRGELIALQCSIVRTEEMAHREREIIAKLGDHLAGPLASYVHQAGRVYERGFLAACRCDARKFANGVAEPSWATVRAITFMLNRGIPTLNAFLASPPGRSVRELFGLDGFFAGSIESDRITAISHVGMIHAALPNLPNLRSLGASVVRQDAHVALVEGPLWPKLERFRINDHFHRVPYWIDAMPSSMVELVLCEARPHAVLEQPEGWTMTIAKGTLTIEMHSRSSEPMDQIVLPLLGRSKLVVVPSRALDAVPDLRDRLVALSA